jgi:hypothetical protein
MSVEGAGLSGVKKKTLKLPKETSSPHRSQGELVAFF